MYEIAALKFKDEPYRETNIMQDCVSRPISTKLAVYCSPQENIDCFERRMDKRVRKHKSLAQTHCSAGFLTNQVSPN